MNISTIRVATTGTAATPTVALLEGWGLGVCGGGGYYGPSYYRYRRLLSTGLGVPRWTRFWDARRRWAWWAALSANGHPTQASSPALVALSEALPTRLWATERPPARNAAG
jgi:hypothetical protein